MFPKEDRVNTKEENPKFAEFFGWENSQTNSGFLCFQEFSAKSDEFLLSPALWKCLVGLIKVTAMSWVVVLQPLGAEVGWREEVEKSKFVHSWQPPAGVKFLKESKEDFGEPEWKIPFRSVVDLRRD